MVENDLIIHSPNKISPMTNTRRQHHCHWNQYVIPSYKTITIFGLWDDTSILFFNFHCSYCQLSLCRNVPSIPVHSMGHDENGNLYWLILVAYSFILPSLFMFVYHRWSPGNACGFITICQPWAMMVISMYVYVILTTIGLVYRLKRQINAVVTSSFGQSRDDVRQSQGSTDSSRFHENLNVVKNFAIIVGALVLIWLPQTIISLKQQMKL